MDAPTPDPPRGAFAVLRHPAFRLIWIGSFVSNVGNWMEAVAQAWLVQKQTDSAFLVELLAASEFVPVALLTLAAGALADRYDRRRLVLAGQIAMMILAAGLAIATHLGLATPWVVIAFALGEGAAWAAVMPSWQALVPSLIPRQELPSAIALNSAQFNTARLFGPMLAGGLLAWSGAALVFDVNVVTFVAIVLALWLAPIPRELTSPHHRVAPDPSGAPGGAVEAPASALHRTGFFAGVRWVLGQRGPRRLLFGMIAFSILVAPVQGLLPVYADRLLRVGAGGYGALLSCLGAGAILGALSLSRLPKRYPRHHLIPLSMLGFACCALVYGLSRWMLLSCAALALGGIFWVWSLASSSTAMQLLVPDQLRGRAMSTLSLGTMGPLPLGHLLGGALATAFGPRVAVASTAAGLALFAIWGATFREPAIDALPERPAPPRGLRAAIWEALTAQSHRAQQVEPGVPPGSTGIADR